jgi:hypothetical protein
VVETLLFCGSHEALRVGIQIRTARGQSHGFHAGSFENAVELVRVQWITRSMIFWEILGRRGCLQFWLPSYFWAMSLRYQAMTVSGVNRTVVCSRSSRVS